MNEVIVGLFAILTSLTAIPQPDAQPVIKEVPRQVILEKACDGNEQVCKDLYVYTDPKNGDILVTRGIDWNYTFAKGELLIELARFSLDHHGVYKITNDCKTQATLENALEQVRWDYIRREVDSGRYLGEGLPQIADLPHHIFYCGGEKLKEISI